MSKKARIELKPFIRKEKGFQSCVLEGSIRAETERAVLFAGTVLVEEGQFCRRCGKDITNRVSQLVGYGPECSVQLGIPREFSEHDLEEIKAKIQKDQHQETWLPKSQITILERGDSLNTVEQNKKNDKEAVNITCKQGKIQVQAPYIWKDRLKETAGSRWSKQDRVWEYPASPVAMENLLEVFRGCEILMDEGAQELKRQADTLEEAQERKDADELPDVPVRRHSAWLHQRQAYWFAKDLPAVLLDMAMGTGKTKVAIDIAVNRGHKAILIVAPSYVVTNVWEDQIREHMPEGQKYRVLICGNNRSWSVKQKKRKAEQTLQLAKGNSEMCLIVINYESAWREPFADWSLKAGFDMAIMDESHRIKSPSGKASRWAKRLGERVTQRLALTGTPMPHSPLDIYAQFRFLDTSILGTSFSRFRARYAVMGGYGGHEVLGFQRERELYEKLDSVRYSVGAEVLDLPPAQHIKRSCALSGEALKLYNSMEKSFYAEMEAGEITATNALTKLLRLQQITSGHINTDEGNTLEVGSAKKDLLKEILSDIGKEPVVIFCRFTQDIKIVKDVIEALGDGEDSVSELSGNANELSEWKEGKTRVLVAQIQAGGVGIDLTRARYCIYYSLGYSLGDYEQSLARVHRPKQERSVVYYHLLAEGTVDEKVYKALKSRKEVVESILKGGV